MFPPPAPSAARGRSAHGAPPSTKGICGGRAHHGLLNKLRRAAKKAFRRPRTPFFLCRAGPSLTRRVSPARFGGHFHGNSFTSPPPPGCPHLEASPFLTQASGRHEPRLVPLAGALLFPGQTAREKMPLSRADSGQGKLLGRPIPTFKFFGKKKGRWITKTKHSRRLSPIPLASPPRGSGSPTRYVGDSSGRTWIFPTQPTHRETKTIDLAGRNPLLPAPGGTSFPRTCRGRLRFPPSSLPLPRRVLLLVTLSHGGKFRGRIEAVNRRNGWQHLTLSSSLAGAPPVSGEICEILVDGYMRLETH